MKESQSLYVTRVRPPLKGSLGRSGLKGWWGHSNITICSQCSIRPHLIWNVPNSGIVFHTLGTV